MALKMVTESQDIFSSTTGALTLLLRESAHFATGVSKVHYLKSGCHLANYIPVGHGLDTVHPSLFLWNWYGLQD